MFFDDLEKAVFLSKNSDFSIFVTKSSTGFLELFPKNSSFTIEPENGKITVDRVRDIIRFCHKKITKDYYIIILNAEKLNEQAENALLKMLEEPPKNYHFVLQVFESSALLPTILSRGDLYVERIKNTLSAPVIADSTQKLYAKRIITAKSAELPSIVQSLTKEKVYKKDARNYVLDIISLAIEISYKSYFSTSNPNFLKKIPALLSAHDNLKQNGHIKLHLVADLC